MNIFALYNDFQINENCNVVIVSFNKKLLTNCIEIEFQTIIWTYVHVRFM